MSGLKEGSLALFFSGSPIRKTSDEDYLFFADRNFVYLTGIEQKETVLMMEKEGRDFHETVFLLPPDAYEERWTGRRLKVQEASEISGAESFSDVNVFEKELRTILSSGRIKKIYLDMDLQGGYPVSHTVKSVCRMVKAEYPKTAVESSLGIMKRLRLIKKKAQEFLAPIGNRTPGNYRYRCFLSDLAGLGAVTPPRCPRRGIGENYPPILL